MNPYAQLPSLERKLTALTIYAHQARVRVSWAFLAALGR